SDAAEGFEQIIDFLSGSYIYYALTVSPPIYISCIKQFWNSVSVKRSGDVTRLQALVDKKKIVISEAVIREILQLNDAEGVNEFSTTMASVVICLSKGQRFNFSKYIFDSLVRNVDSSSKFYMYPRFIQLIIQTNIVDLSTHTTRYISPTLTQKVFANMRRVGKGFSGVETPLFESVLLVRDVAEEAEAQVPAQGDDVQEPAAKEVVTDVVPPTSTPPSPPSPVIPSSPPHQPPCPPQPQDAEGSSLLFQQVLDTCSALARRVEGLENDKAAQQLEIVKLKARVKKLEKINKVKSSKLRRLKKVGTSQRIESSDDKENVFNQGRIIVDMDQDERIELVLSMQEDDTEVQEAVEIVTTAKLMTEVVTAAATQEEINKEHEEAYKNIDWNAALDHVHSKEPQYIKRYHGIKKKPQTESEARKNTIFYLKNTEGYKMDFFKGMKYDEILPIFQAKFDANMRFLFKSREEMEVEDQEIIKSINETPTQKAAKRRKLGEEAQETKDLRKRLEIVKDEDDDVFVEATPLAQKVPVVDYQIVVIDNKLDGQDAIWRNQKSVYGLALVKRWKLLTSCGVHVITLSERRYPLLRFTLEQLVNVARLQVEEESEMSLELLRFTRQQLQEYQQRSKKNTKCVSAANEELFAAKHKLMLLKLFKDVNAAADAK
nr:hypothetical protein [Tanacetum cinerariifolium]